MSGPVDAVFFERLTQANERFRAGLPATLAQLAAVRDEIEPDSPAPALVAELQSLLHTLAGAAVTFGFRELGQGARQLEQRLRVLTAFETVGEDDWSAWLDALTRFVQAGLGAPAPGYHSSAFAILP
ncbi:MAG TPA: hypothetical protein DCX52_02130 [Massilia sp.]|nr:hypothetical protein [Massilia sp.]